MKRYGLSPEFFKQRQLVRESPSVSKPVWQSSSVGPVSGRGSIAASTLPSLSRVARRSDSNGYETMQLETSSVEASSPQQQGAIAYSVEELRSIVLTPKCSLEEPTSRPRLTRSSPQVGRCSYPPAASRDPTSPNTDSLKNVAWNGGVSSVMISWKKNGNANIHENPFVEYEDREQRRQWERIWLKDDEVYMDERLKGIRVNSRQTRMQRKEVPQNVLYQDAVYFGAYSKELKQSQKRAAVRRPQALELPTFETEHAMASKNKKNPSDIRNCLSSIKSMKAALQVSAVKADVADEDAPMIYLSEGAIADFKALYKHAAQG